MQCLPGENGILNKAKLAKENSDIAGVEEQNKLEIYNDALENYEVTARGITQTENYISDGSEILLNKTYNGKQVYSSTMTGAINSGTGLTFKDLTSYNIDKVINTYGFFYGDSGNTYGTINTYYTSAAYTAFYYNIPTKILRYHCGTQYNGATAYVTIEYTKTS